MRLTRSNDDPKLLDDLERLARSYGDPEREPVPMSAELAAHEAAEAEAAAAAAAAETADASPLDDPFVRRFVRVSVHVKRYAPIYAGAAVWAFAMLLIQPLGGDKGGTETGNLASASTGTIARRSTTATVPAASVADTEVAAAPVFDDFGGSSLSSSSSSFDSFDASDSSSTSDSFASGSSSSTSSSFDDTSSGTATFDDSEFGAFDDGPMPIAVVASGYASSLGGTPLEQDPGGGGLPVAATGGNDNKRSFVRLTGDETVLRLQEAAEGGVRSDAGGVKACAITADWTPARGQALDAAPAFDVNNCATGIRDANGLWTFDLSSFGPVRDTKGFALTPAAGTASTFQVVFGPMAVQATA
jgi:hypothetical protein